MSILMIKDRLNRPPFARLQRRDRIAAVANGLHVKVHALQMALVRFLLGPCLVGDFGEVLRNVAVGQGLGLEVVASPFGRRAFEAGVVAEHPAVALFGVAQRVAGEPGYAQVGFAGAGQVVEVH